jgi:hypothetical protein
MVNGNSVRMGSSYLRMREPMLSYMSDMGTHSRLRIIMPDETVAKPTGQARTPSAYELRPLAQARKIPLIEREVHEFLSQAALDAIFARCEVLSEGEAGKGQGPGPFVGSTMLTFDVTALGELMREPADEGTARRLAALLAQEKSLAGRIETIVRREVERLIQRQPRQVHGDTRIRTQGTRVFLDIDVEASLS